MISILNDDPFGFESNLEGVEKGGMGIGGMGMEEGEGMLKEYFNPNQTQSSFKLPEWALEESIDQHSHQHQRQCHNQSSSSSRNSSSSQSSQTGEKRSRTTRARSNSVSSNSSNSSISNLSVHSLDSLPSLADTDSQNSVESGSEGEEEERLRFQDGWRVNWKGKGNENHNERIEVTKFNNLGVELKDGNSGKECMSHIRKKRCSRKIGGKSSSSENNSSSITSSSPSDSFRNSHSSIKSENQGSQETHWNANHQETSFQTIPPQPDIRPRQEFQPLPSNSTKDLNSNSNDRTSGSRSTFVDKLVDSAVSTLEEIWSVRTGEINCTMPSPPTSTNSSSQINGSQPIGSSNGSGRAISSSPSSSQSSESQSSGNSDSPSFYSSPATSVSSHSQTSSASISNFKETNFNQASTLPSSSSSSSTITTSSSSNSTSNQLPLRYFVRETLRRSKTSCSVLQTALIYCLRARKTIEASVQYSEKLQSSQNRTNSNEEQSLTFPMNHHSSLLCQRRTFLASLILSSKFLQDRTYSNKAWSKISGLNVKELGEMERNLLKVLDWNLFVKEGEWEVWCEEREKKIQNNHDGIVGGGKNDKDSLELVKGEKDNMINGIEVEKLKARSGSFNRSISENVQGMEIKFDTEISLDQSRMLVEEKETPSVYLEDSSTSNSTPIVSSISNDYSSRDSTPTLPLPCPRTQFQGSEDFRPKIRLPFRARSQLNPMKSSPSSSSSTTTTPSSDSSPSPSFGFGMESLHLSSISNTHLHSKHPLSKSLTFSSNDSDFFNQKETFFLNHQPQIDNEEIDFQFSSD